jgi:hypothetical protein
VASLPQSTGQTISFYAGHSPSGSPTAIAGSSASKTSAIFGTSQATTGSDTSAPTSNTGGSSSAAPGSASAASTSTSTLPGGSITTVYLNGPSNSTGGQSGSNGGQGSSPSHVGTGAIVGIAIGAVVGVLLFIALAFFLFRRRKHQRSRSTINSDGAKLSKQRDSDISIKSPVLAAATTPPMPEADGVPVSEMMGRPAEPWKLRSELEGRQVGPGTEAESGTGSLRGEAAREESDALPSVAELPGSEPEPNRNAAPGLVEEAMVAPLNLRPRSEGTRQVPPNDDEFITRP